MRAPGQLQEYLPHFSGGTRCLPGREAPARHAEAVPHLDLTASYERASSKRIQLRVRAVRRVPSVPRPRFGQRLRVSGPPVNERNNLVVEQAESVLPLQLPEADEVPLAPAVETKQRRAAAQRELQVTGQQVEHLGDDELVALPDAR